MAVTTTWNDSNGDFYTAGNWSAGAPQGTPGSEAVIGSDSPSAFNSGTAYTVTAYAAYGGTPYSADTLTLNDSAATLDLGGSTGGVPNDFTLNASMTFTAGTITVEGAGASFGSTASTLGSAAYIIGYGQIGGDIGGNGTIEATGGGLNASLEIQGNVGAGGMTFEVDANSAIQFDADVDASATVKFLSNSGDVVLVDEPNSGNGVFSTTISGLVEDTHTDALPQNNYIVEADLTDPTGATFDASSDAIITTQGTIYLSGSYTTDATLEYAADTNYGGYDLWLAVCFAEGTAILTDRGEVAVESLTDADTVITIDRGIQKAAPVRWIGRRHLDLTTHPRAQHAAPVRIRRGAFAANLPQRDLLVSPDHCLFVDGKLIPAKLLINGMTIVQETAAKSVTYYHVELDRHAVLLAEGLPAESYLDTGNRAFFSNAGLALILHPEFHVNAGLKCWETDACAPLAVSEAAVQPTWNALAARAQTLGFEQPEVLTSDDADLRIVAAGRTFRPVSSNANRVVFVLPAGVTQAHLISRAGSPADAKPWLDDHRQLGVAVSRIVVRGGTDYAEVPVDHPALRQGWHSVETEGRAMWRWTNGRAALPIEASTGAVTIEVHLRATGTYVVATADTARRLAA